MKAVVMAGGEGTRLRPLTSNLPKPMMPMANQPLMEHVLRRLAQHGFDDVVVTVAYLASHIRNFFGDGSELGIRMRYATEETPLGTAGSVRNAAAELDDTFMVISGDVLSDIDLSEVIKAHRASGALATIALKRVENPVDFGIVITREDGSIERFLEKPTWGQVFSDTINTGIYVLEPEIFELIEPGRPVDFSEEVFPAALEHGRLLMGLVVDGYWEDVGTVEAYHRAHEDILDSRVTVDVPGFAVGEGVWLGEGADVDPGAHVVGPAIIGVNCRVESGAQIGEYTVLGSDVVVKRDAFVQRCIVHD
ncbi:MAG: sugar phosphate nucleotidyltransferase, partial [Acidimicrobiia bacterium]